QLAVRADRASQCPSEDSEPSDHDGPIADQSAQCKLIRDGQLLRRDSTTGFEPVFESRPCFRSEMYEVARVAINLSPAQVAISIAGGVQWGRRPPSRRSCDRQRPDFGGFSTTRRLPTTSVRPAASSECLVVSFIRGCTGTVSMGSRD